MARSPGITLLGSKIGNWHYGIREINACKSYEMHEALRTNLNEMSFCLGEEDIIPLSSSTVAQLSSRKRRSQPQYLRSRLLVMGFCQN